MVFVFKSKLLKIPKSKLKHLKKFLVLNNSSEIPPVFGERKGKKF